MGNCCCPSTDDVATSGAASGNNNSKRQPAAFQGEGHRLGTSQESQALKSESMPQTQQQVDDEVQIQYDNNLTDEERAKIRADRAAAAEARLKKMGSAPAKKKKVDSNKPLVGPNSQPTMRWSAG